MLKFDAETTRLLETAYLGADITARRKANLDALQIRPGEHVLDIGCGNGLLLTEAARATGSEGKVWGIDPSDDMRAAALKRCTDLAQVEILPGAADALPLPDNSIDKAVSVQVFEYLNDVPSALATATRVLRPGGRLVIGDMHFGTLTWYSENPRRMADMIAAWNRHVVDIGLPDRLPRMMSEVGFRVESVSTLTTSDHLLRPDGLARMMIALMEPYAVSNGHVSAETARDWADEQFELARTGKFFFSLTHFVVTATKP